MFGIGDYTFSDWKAVWREQASSFTVAVVGPVGKRVVIPDHKLMIASASSKEEAHYICSVLSSSPAKLAVASYTVEIQVSTHVLENVNVPQFELRNRLHMQLSELSVLAHKAAKAGKEADIREIEQEIDSQVMKLWGLTDAELAEIKQSLEEM